MYRKYYEVWAAQVEKYGPRTALLYQVGGFFEIYDTENLTTGTTKANIREIAELCQLSLTQHAVEDSVQTLFGGFPDHALGKFEKILVQAGWTVVVVVQRKGKTGAVEERIVDHISSPGCYVDSSVKERRLVGCVLESMSDGPAALRRVYWGAAALDFATGALWVMEGAGSGNPDRLHQFLCMHPPSEIVIWSDGLPAANALTESLKSLCTASHLRCLAPASAAIDESILLQQWSPALTKPILQQPQARRTLAALLEFAGDHMPSALRCLQPPESWVPDGEVRLGNAALEQLGLLSLRGDEKRSLLGLMDRCRSVAGRRLMRSRLLRPISVIAELEARLDRIEAAAKRDPVPTERGLRSLYDISRLWRRLELGTATINDMACLLRSYEAASTLGFDDPGFLTWIFSQWSLDATASLARDGTGAPISTLPFVPGSSPDAETMFAEGLAIREEAVALCKVWSSGSGSGPQTKGKVEQLYLDDAEGGGFRITGTKRRINAVWTQLRDSGDTSARITAYKTSAILETAALDALSTRHREWFRAWAPVWNTTWSAAIAEVVKRGAEASPAIEAWCADLDLSWTMAGLANEWLWKRPVFVDAAEGVFEATNLRHPILERIQLGGNPYISHTVGLSSLALPLAEEVAWTKRGLLLYGMNASGKSSLMKAIGICTLLAQVGFPVPATSCRLSPFTAIFTRILGNDNLWAGLSSFAVEMTEFREILRFADERSLVLGDELCSGTESLSATALVAAGVESLAARGSKFVFATHLHELATLPDIAGLSTVKAVHLKVHYDAAADVLVYDRHLAEGSGSALYGLEVCRALDLPAGYLDRATAIRKSLAGWVAPQETAYSAAAVLDRCAVCGSTDRLEAHHVVPQASSATAAAAGFDIHAPSNLVALCAACHDDHHGGRLVIQGWEETSAGRRLQWSRRAAGDLDEEVVAWIREQRQLKIRVATIQRMAKQIFGLEVTSAQVKAT